MATPAPAPAPTPTPPALDPVLAAADPESPDYEPLILEEEPVLVLGCATADAVLGTCTNPLAGGVVGKM